MGIFTRIFVGMPAEIQTARGLSVVGCLIWLIMMIMGVFGLNCTTWRAGSRSKASSFQRTHPLNRYIIYA